MHFDASEFPSFSEKMDLIRSSRGESDLFVDWCNPCERLRRSEEFMLSSLAEFEQGTKVCSRALIPYPVFKIFGHF
jgi:hypothetical protein